MGWKDEFDDDPRFAGIVANLLGALDVRDRIGARSPLFAVGMVAVTVAVLAGVLWYSYPKAAADQELRAVPIVRADAGPIKIIPADPGGMDIPYRDSTVFDTLRASREENGPDRIENLLPESEKPLPREELFAGLKTDLAIAPGGAPNGVTTKEAPAVQKPAQKQAVSDIAPAHRAAPAPVAKPTRTEARNAAKTEPASGTTQGDYYVQLGSLRSRADAEKAWDQNKTAFPAQLGNLTLRVQVVDLGAKGTYYRVQGGAIDQATAKSICRAVETKRPGGCLVVKR